MGGFRLFTLADVPVWVSPWYIFLLLYMSMRGAQYALVFGACITISLIVHEMGHALTAKRYKLGPEILLHGFGGLTAHRPARTNGQEALIIAAGPAAGLLLYAVSAIALPFVPAAWGELPVLMLSTLKQINLFWSIFNLLPMWPMDGGQLYRLGMLKLLKPGRAERVVHITGIVLAGLTALIASRLGFGIFMFMILALTAWENVQALMSGNNQPVRRDNPRARELMNEAERAYQQGNDDEAARVCQQLRAESNIPPQILARVWTILGVTTTRKGEYEEALSYLKRAPDSPEAVEATAQCFYQLEMYEALEALTKTRAFLKLPNDTREQIEKALAEAESASAG